MAHSFLEFIEALNNARVRYLVAGGMAVNLHGVPRMTKDLDLYVDLSRPNLTKALGTLELLGLRPRIPVTAAQIASAKVRAGWIRDKNMKALQLVDSRDLFHPVDIFIEHLVPFAMAWKRRVVIEAGELPIPLMSVRDLITLKKKAGREQDLADIASLQRLEET